VDCWLSGGVGSRGGQPLFHLCESRHQLARLRIFGLGQRGLLKAGPRLTPRSVYTFCRWAIPFQSLSRRHVYSAAGVLFTVLRACCLQCCGRLQCWVKDGEGLFSLRRQRSTRYSPAGWHGIPIAFRAYGCIFARSNRIFRNSNPIPSNSNRDLCVIQILHNKAPVIIYVGIVYWHTVDTRHER